MKYFIYCCFGLLSFHLSQAQNTSQSFTVTGEVLKEETIDIAKIIIHLQKT
jgi:hypothetical protein